MSENNGDEAEGETFRLAVKVASDITPFGVALGEMLRTLDNMDKRLALACGENVPSPAQNHPEPDDAHEKPGDADSPAASGSG